MGSSQLLNLTVPHPNSPLTRPVSAQPSTARARPLLRDWASLQKGLKCKGRFSCLFSDNRREEQARKALEGALGGKKSEFEKWNKEIKRREEAGGGDGGGGGWFGWGGRFGWSNGDDFWQEAQQMGLTILGIICMYLIIAKGEVLLAVIFNPLLFVLRGARNSLTFATSQILRRISPNTYAQLVTPPQKETYTRVSAKEEVLRKWGNN
ncbi:uncharacterized protein LOC116206395 [Punica granatum]|uniref:Sulfate adenylyltransferase subunit 2 n=2 Tax=Punica granatum TaxID=22663 RepID=A0A218XF10_PUNGR|nr:uncharacterized protein LOC116206395 [Punica granatum]OWM83340.1 hypothetical protein CDL15_Pgr012821 [Punica granatum]PKI66407.1 hypothetical protein CRG98_013209 [Punica granatum]